MADSLAISPISLSGLAGIPPVAFQRLTTGTAASTSAIFTSASNIVELSSNGQLLSATSSFRTNLEALQATATDSSPSVVVTTAQGLVETFNSLQGSTSSLQTLVTALSSDTLATQLSLTLSQLATASLTVDNATLNSLQSIGIDLQTTPAATGTSVTLRIDPNRLTAAISADLAGTQAVLTEAIQSFIELATEFESQVASTTVSLSNLTQLGVTATPQIDLSSLLGLQANSAAQVVGVAIDQLQNLDADTVLNAIRLTDLDLAAAGVDAGPLLMEESLQRAALAAALLTPNSALSTPINSPTTDTPETPDTTIQLAGMATPITTTTPDRSPALETEVTTTPVLDAVTISMTGNQGIATTATSAAAADALAADRRASEATLALQARLADPSLRAINNHFDPAYSALIAAAHLSDFVSPDRVNNPQALANEAVGPVLPIAIARAIAYYNDATGEESRQMANRTQGLSSRQLMNSPRYETSA